MIVRLIALGLIMSISYILWVFFAPEFTDTYGNISLNAKIREIKNLSLEFASGSEDPASLIDTITSSSQVYIDETKRTYENIENTVSGKLLEVKAATDSVEQAYKAVKEAKDDINKVIGTSSWSTPK